ncbi:conserved hypothetical protein [Candidatus Desulfarcum epimagneticum]|uniref:DUF433 domain-containing protein n=1 Tax=uncultured Desulfobacteraceae bacterium TaxID=218296 RepID=A0A484HLK9_9BACT|nr:conserved hypothetical protein [uncultured Desulfobacteraceae bacterium]
MTHFNMNDYFDFVDADDIRIKGTRVGIETVLDDYLNAMSPEQIAIRYPALTLEQVYATVTFYLRNQTQVDRYLDRWRLYSEKAWLDQRRRPSPAVRRLQELKRRRSPGVTA